MSLTNPFLAPVEETIHGTLVHDPYRWLEDRSLPETEEWVREQHRRFDAYFQGCKDLGAIRERVRKYLDVEITDQPSRIGAKYFYRCRNREQEQASIYVEDAHNGRERLLVSPSGLFASVAIHRISEDGSLLAYERKLGGGDRKAIHILNVERGETLQDFIETGYARGFSFTTDSSGFFYCHEIAGTSKVHSIRLHRFDSPKEDVVCFRLESIRGSRLVLIADQTHLGALGIHREKDGGHIDFWMARRSEPGNWWPVFVNRKSPYSPILAKGRIFALSFAEASNGKLVELNRIGQEIRTVVPETDVTIRQLAVAGGKVFINGLKQMQPSLQYWDIDNERREDCDIPRDGTIQLLAPFSEAADSVFCRHESFNVPPVIFEYGLATGAKSLWDYRGIPVALPQGVLHEATFPSFDNVQIPITLITHSQSQQEQRPVIMTSYGGFGVPVTPQFSVLVTIMLELGAAFALPHIRGGGEFGSGWHNVARGRKRQVAVDDFIAGAEWLIAEHLTSSEQLVIFGGSNSGLLVASAMTQRPDLFRAVLCIAPLLDMVRYELFDDAAKWSEEYGTVDDPDDFTALHECSPYHQVADERDYPAVLFVTGDKDDRCNPAHVRKMAARLQGRCAQSSAVIVDYSEERGHSPVLPLSIRVEALARRIAFLCHELSLPVDFGGVHDVARA